VAHLKITFEKDSKSTWQKVARGMGIPIPESEGDVAPSGSAGLEG